MKARIDTQTTSTEPMIHLDNWEEYLHTRYPAAESGKPK